MSNRVLSIGEKFPAFRKKAVVSIEKGKEFTEITQEYASADGKWTVMFWWPKDFTFVCPTEIAERSPTVPLSSLTPRASFAGSASMTLTLAEACRKCSGSWMHCRQMNFAPVTGKRARKHLLPTQPELNSNISQCRLSFGRLLAPVVRRLESSHLPSPDRSSIKNETSPPLRLGRSRH